MQLPQLPADKANHAVYGYVAAAIASVIGSYYGVPKEVAALIGSCSVGALKELADYIANRMAAKRGEQPLHSVDPYDFLATAAGGLPLAGVSLVG